jgi:uncharacterized protein (UPF0248 family)
VPELTELDRDLRLLESTLRRLETEYNMFFAGQLPKPPLETRKGVEALLRRYDRAYIQSAVDRFRLSTLQSRFSTFAELWDRALRAREEGRAGPFYKPPRPEAPEDSGPAPTADRILRVTTVGDPVRDEDKIEALYDSLVEARRVVGNDEAFPYHRFVQIVKAQMTRLKAAGSQEVAFRVAVKDGKVAFTARGLKSGEGAGE